MSTNVNNKIEQEQELLKAKLAELLNNPDDVLKILNIKKAQTDFWTFCHMMLPGFYTKSRTYLKTFCKELQEFIEKDFMEINAHGEEERTRAFLVINLPPRHGKTLTLSYLNLWMIGKDPEIKLMSGSYSEEVAKDLSRNVRDQIQTEPEEGSDMIVYNDIFEDIKMKKDNNKAAKWAVEGGYSTFMATSPGGKSTGFGADIIIIDDLIKNDTEAFDKQVLDKHVKWFERTLASRLEKSKQYKFILVMTRWSLHDLSGHVLEEYEENGYIVKHITMKAYDEETNTMLCDEIFSKRDYDAQLKTVGKAIILANYQQEPLDVDGVLYNNLQTYKKAQTPANVLKSWAYIDPANEGKDYLCAIFFDETEDGRGYIKDIIYTQDNIKASKPLIAEKLIELGTHECVVEKNNFGGVFADDLQELVGNKTIITKHHQSANKKARIFQYSRHVEELMVFPETTKQVHTNFWSDVTTYQARGRNKFDDAPDCLTGCVEILRHDIVNKIKVNPLDRLKQASLLFR